MQEKIYWKKFIDLTKGKNLNSFKKNNFSSLIYKRAIKPIDKAIKDELNYYKKEISINKLDFSNFWKKHSTSLPLSASNVRKFCIIPASSVASESSFSEANLIQRKERSSLSSKNLSFSIVIKSAMRSSIYPNLNFHSK